MNRSTLYENYDYTNEEFIDERLKCPICTNPLIEPVKTKCQPKEHAFCYRCIKDWLRRSSSCPKCRQNLKKEDLLPITEGILLDMLNELQVQCLICKTKRIERGNYVEHFNKHCNKPTISCTSADIECPWSGTQKGLGEHLKICPYTALRPMISQILNYKKQLQQTITQQQILIDQLKEENKLFKDQTQTQRRPLPPLPNGKSSQEPKRNRESNI